MRKLFLLPIFCLAASFTMAPQQEPHESETENKELFNFDEVGSLLKQNHFESSYKNFPFKLGPKIEYHFKRGKEWEQKDGIVIYKPQFEANWKWSWGK